MDLKVCTDYELDQLRHEVQIEQERRQTLATASGKAAEIVRAYQAAIGRQDGDPFVKPTGYHDAYSEDSVVSHEGKEWTATRDGANGTPGESPDWIEKVSEGEIPEWEQRHFGSEYEVGALVQMDGVVYRNDLEVPNGYRPDAPHSGWTNLGPIDEYEQS